MKAAAPLGKYLLNTFLWKFGNVSFEHKLSAEYVKLGLLLRNGVQNKGYNGRIQDYDINMSVFNYAEFGSFGVVFQFTMLFKTF